MTWRRLPGWGNTWVASLRRIRAKGKRVFLPVVVQSLSHVWLFVIPWTTARQASLSFTLSWSLLKLMSIELVMPSNRLILCCPLLLLPLIFPSIKVFSNESVLCIRWPEYWSLESVNFWFFLCLFSHMMVTLKNLTAGMNFLGMTLCLCLPHSSCWVLISEWLWFLEHSGAQRGWWGLGSVEDHRGVSGF